MSDLIMTTPGRVRPRRLRRTPAMRNLVAETDLSARQLVLPHFVIPVEKAERAIPSMPGISLLGLDTLVRTVEEDLEIGIRAVLLFGHPREGAKSPDAVSAFDRKGAVQQATRRLKAAHGDDLVVMTDVCLCAYTDHGHCGLIDDGRLVNDPSLRPLASTALSHAEAGVDVVAPSDMMDGRIGAIRDALDAGGFEEVAVLSYAVKYASAYYGPFRDAAESAPVHGDRQSHQMDCRNVREALKEVALDQAEGADMLMVKPALPCLDVIHAVRQASTLPLAAYNVSGEYAAVKAAAANGWLEEPRVVRENLMAIRRAGADVIITYHARDALKGGWL